MKTIFRFLSMAALVAGIAVTGALAQDVCSDVDTPTAQYEKFLGLYNRKPGVIAEKEEAINIGKAFLEKFGACEAWKDQSAFVKPWIPRLEKQIENLKLQAEYNKFDAGMQSKKWEDVFAAGKAINSMAPDRSLDQLIAMGMVGLVESYGKNYRFNDESLAFAKIAIDKLNAGAPSVNTKFGVYQFAMGSKENAISELSYATAYINYYAKGNKKGSIASFYNVVQMPGSKKDFAPAYATIGEFYLDEAAPIGVEIAKLIEAIKTAPTEEEKLKLNDQAKAKEALFNGYTERAMDAYSRAWKFAKEDTPAGKKYKDGLLATIQDLYKRRFDKETGVNEWVSTATAKPLPDPTSAVQPVVDPETTTTSNTTTGTSVGLSAVPSTSNGAASVKTVAAPVPAKAAVAKKP